jgi:hypothetical protein
LGWKYTNSSAAATLYQQLNGIHAWHIAPSGTADAGVTFTQAMTLDASGRLAVGVTTTSGRIIADFDATGNKYVNIVNAAGTIGLQSYGAFSSSHLRMTYPSVADWDMLANSGGALTFSNGAERARITSGGDLLVGDTSTGLRNSNSLSLEPSASGAAFVNHANGSASGNGYIFFGYNASTIGSITQSGTTAVLYNVMSDYRLKTVTGAVTGQGARIDALKPIDYQWKESNQQARGFLAHEFQEVYPSSVSGNKDAIDKDGKPAYQSMQAATSEVIADLVAEIQSLRKRLATLESA